LDEGTPKSVFRGPSAFPRTFPELGCRRARPTAAPADPCNIPFELRLFRGFRVYEWSCGHNAGHGILGPEQFRRGHDHYGCCCAAPPCSVEHVLENEETSC
jgi:hypothetical protein